MKRLLDVNAWIALTIDRHLHHQIARAWYDSVETDGGKLVFCRPTEMGFLRLVTQEKLMRQFAAPAMTNAEAIKFLTRVCQDPGVSRADEPAGTRSLWLELAEGRRASPNVWMDAYLAAFAIRLGAEMVTFDRGFASYEGRGLKLALLNAP